MIGNVPYSPSEISDDIYYILQEIHSKKDLSEDTYPEVEATEAIMKYFNNHPHIQWSLGCTDWPNEAGGVCYYSWVENGKLYMEGFDYIS